VPGSTKLFQRAGSPLIQGRSRYARSFSAQWIGALGTSAAAVYVALAAATLYMGEASPWSSVSAGVAWLLSGAGGLAAALVGSAVGVGVARGMGWRRAWIAGAVPGVLLGVVVLLWTWQLL
jgi:hypothetical protein